MLMISYEVEALETLRNWLKTKEDI